MQVVQARQFLTVALPGCSCWPPDHIPRIPWACRGASCRVGVCHPPPAAWPRAHPCGSPPVGARVPGATSAPLCSLRIPAGHEHPKKRLPLPRLPVPRAGTETVDVSKILPRPQRGFEAGSGTRRLCSTSRRRSWGEGGGGNVAAPRPEFSRSRLMG